MVFKIWKWTKPKLYLKIGMAMHRWRKSSCPQMYFPILLSALSLFFGLCSSTFKHKHFSQTSCLNSSALNNLPKHGLPFVPSMLVLPKSSYLLFGPGSHAHPYVCIPVCIHMLFCLHVMALCILFRWWYSECKPAFWSCVFQSGWSPSGPERTLPAHVSTGRICGQELHPVQSQTSLKDRMAPLSPAWSGSAPLSSAQPHNPKALSTAIGFSRTANISVVFTSPTPPKITYCPFLINDLAWWLLSPRNWIQVRMSDAF